MFSIMLFLFLGFLGIIALLVYLLISQDRYCHTLRDEHAQLRVLLRSMESRVASLEAALHGNAAKQGSSWEQEKEALLKLDFSESGATTGNDPNLDLHMDFPKR